MSPKQKTIVAAISLLAAGMLLGLGLAHWQKSAQLMPAEPAVKAERKVLYWYDPMMPVQKFDKPGKSPFMDMELVPRYADEAGADHGRDQRARPADPAVSVRRRLHAWPSGRSGR